MRPFLLLLFLASVCTSSAQQILIKNFKAFPADTTQTYYFDARKGDLIMVDILSNNRERFTSFHFKRHPGITLDSLENFYNVRRSYVVDQPRIVYEIKVRNDLDKEIPVQFRIAHNSKFTIREIDKKQADSLAAVYFGKAFP